MLDANETQESSLALVFHYADAKGLALLDLADLRALLTFLDSDDGKAELEGIGGLSKATVGVLLRSLVALETGGGNELFGEPQLDVADLLRVAEDGRGVISCLELAAVQDKPKLFSTALMWLLAELFETLPEAGDLPKPKLVFFFDEAHLLFDDATEAFLDAVAQTVRLIRSKGVGVFFVTQTPKDVPGDVLGQLGNRVQHALRAFTPEDAKALKATVSTFPRSDLYDLEELLPALGIGEAAVTILSESGVPTPVVHTRMRRAALADGARRRRRRAGRRLAAAREVRHARGARERARAARRADGARARARARRARARRPRRTRADGARARSAAPARAGAEAVGRRRGHRRLPHLAPGQGAAAPGAARRLRHAAQAAVSTSPFSAEHEELRASIRRFVAAELRPHASEWEDARWFPDEVFARMAQLGFLGLKYPEAYGGQGGDHLHDAVLVEELARCGSGGLAAGIGAHVGIATPPVWKFGTEDQKQRYLAPAIAGEKIAALAITEPGAGSDVAAHPHPRRARRRRLGRQRREDVHHQRRARALPRHRRADHGSRAATTASAS